jgi:predicted  nucleic acid-binding Zn-ribbon protein
MSIAEGFQRLAELQACDDELFARDQAHAALPGQRTRLAEEAAAAVAAAAAAREALAAAEQAQRRAEGELQDQEALRRRLESQQFQVKSNDAYTVLLREIEQAQRAISDCETRLLEGMDAIESARAACAAAERADGETQARVSEQTRSLDVREQQLETELERLRGARAQIVAGTDPKLIEQYEKIATRRRPAVVRVRGTLCLGCRVDVPPQQCIEIQRAERVVTCGNCHRMLIGNDRS